jgi:hypothetical protein
MKEEFGMINLSTSWKFFKKKSWISGLIYTYLNKVNNKLKGSLDLICHDNKSVNYEANRGIYKGKKKKEK